MHASFLDEDTLHTQDLDLTALEACFKTLTKYPVTSPEQTIERLQDADVAIVNKVVLDEQVFAALPNLKHVLVAATGINNVDLEAARSRDISVQNCQAYGVSSVAQHTLMLMLALCTRLLDYRQAIQQGKWSQSPFFCLLDYSVIDLSGKTLGIVGYGDLGRAVARLAEAFGMRVIVAAWPGKSYAEERMELAHMLPQVDILSLHCPLTQETNNLIGRSELQAMKTSALLVNCARGGIVNEDDLLTALRNNTIAGAATDVLSQEPPPEDHPMLQYGGNNLIITPHSAWASQKARQTIINQLVQNMVTMQHGKPQFLRN